MKKDFFHTLCPALKEKNIFSCRNKVLVHSVKEGSEVPKKKVESSQIHLKTRSINQGRIQKRVTFELKL